MATQIDMVLADGQTTPVNHTFSARGASVDLARWMDISVGRSIGMPTITLGCKNTGKGNDAAWRCELRVAVPVMEVISGSDGGYTPAPKIAYTMFANTVLVAPARSTLQERKDVLAYLKGALSVGAPINAFTAFDIPT